MWVESEGCPARASTFHFTIRAAAAPAPSRPTCTGQPDLEGKRVLIVDDNATNRRILTLQAESWGMAGGRRRPAEALLWIVAQGSAFDLALLDMQMPDMDGVTLAGEIRRLCAGEAAPGHADLAGAP